MQPKPQQEDPDDPIKRPLLLLSYVRKHWLLAVTVCVSVTGAALFYTLGQTKIYRSSMTILIDPSAPSPLGHDVQSVVDLGTGLYWNNQEYYQTQYRIIQSRSIAEEAVRRLGLDKDPTFITNEPSDAVVDDIGPIDVKTAASVLLTRLGVDPVKESRLVAISFDDAQPERAKRIVSTLVSIYIDRNIDRAIDSTKTASEWLEVQLEKLKRELTANELALHDFKRDQNILSVSMDDQNNMLREEMQQLNAELTRVRVERERLKSRLDQLERADPENPEELPAQELLDSRVLNELRGMYATVRQEVTALEGAGKGENHPEVRAAVARAESLKRGLSEEISNIKTAVRRSYAAKQQEAASLLQLYEAATRKAQELNHLELEYRRLERSKVNTEKLYSVVLERAKESGLTQMMRFNNISVVDEATLPKKPIKPRVGVNLAGGMLGGLLLGLIGAFARAAFDRTIQDPEEIEGLLGLPVLGLLPRASHSGRRGRAVASGDLGLTVHNDPLSGVAEAARGIRTNLTFIAPDRPKRRILITSAGVSEGKTTIACSVAMAMAQAGQRVLLIDCDLRRPRLHTVFGRDNRSGVTTAVLDPARLDRKKLCTTYENLSLLTAGPHAPNPAELLQSEKFGLMLESLDPAYDRLVLDSPPVAAVTDATILATRVDATVFVVRCGSSRRDVVRHAVKTLKGVADNLVGVVLNSADKRRGGYGGYYYGYYGRESEGANAEVPPSLR